jgi:hypothetical protein
MVRIDNLKNRKIPLCMTFSPFRRIERSTVDGPFLQIRLQRRWERVVLNSLARLRLSPPNIRAFGDFLCHRLQRSRTTPTNARWRRPVAAGASPADPIIAAGTAACTASSLVTLAGTRECVSRVPAERITTLRYGVGRGNGVGRGRGVTLGVALGVAVGVTVGVPDGVADGVTEGVTVGVAVGVGVAPAAQKISIDASGVRPSTS